MELVRLPRLAVVPTVEAVIDSVGLLPRLVRLSGSLSAPGSFPNNPWWRIDLDHNW